MADFHGLLVLDKPGGITSRDAVNRAQGWFPRGTRLGHTGTLDPLATGVLVLCVGAATRLAEYVQRMPKTYHAGIVLGARSDTDDADGTITPTPDVVPPTRAQVDESLRTFLGELEQVPPAYSAAKVQGRRAYALARSGQETTLAPRVVTIHAIDVERYEYPHLDVEVRCGKGTYIRSLARDLGDRLGCGGYIDTLRRTAVGRFDVSQAIALEADPVIARDALLPLALAVADLPSLTVTPDDARRLRQGQPLAAPDLERLPGSGSGSRETSGPAPGRKPHDFRYTHSNPALAGEVALFDKQGTLVAVGRIDARQGLLKPDKVFGRSA